MLFEGHEIEDEERSAERYWDCTRQVGTLVARMGCLTEAERYLPENRDIYNRVVAMERLARYHWPAAEAVLALQIAREREERAVREREERAVREREEAERARRAPGRPYVPVADLAARYRAQGLDLSHAWSQFVRDTLLQPIVRSDAVDMPQFAQYYRGGGL